MNKIFFPVLFSIIVLVSLSFTVSNFLYTRSSVQAQSVSAANASDSLNLFTRTVSQGDSGQDVLLLQQILNEASSTQIAQSGIGSPGNESTYFGGKTRTALIIFQEQYGIDTIATTRGIVVGTGIASTATEAELSYLYQAHQNISRPAMSLSSADTVEGKPQIISISPSTVSEGDEITIKGNNFDATDTVSSTFDKFPTAKSSDGHTIRLDVHSVLEQQLNKKLSFIKDSNARKEVKKSVLLFMQKDFVKSLIQGIPFKIQVQNSVGTSNSVTIYYKLN